MHAVPDKKYCNVLHTIRQRILDGVYSPSHRLPTWSELGAEFSCGAGTIQKAIDVLVDDGFLELRARKGTFVADSPPHLCNYGFLMPDIGQWSMYFRALRDAAGIVEESECVHLREYLTSSDVALRRDVVQLSRDVVSSKLGGLIIVTPLHDIEATPALKQIGLPRVFVNGEPAKGLPTVAFDFWDSFLPRAIECLTAQGCRRIAHIRFAGEPYDFERLGYALAKAGIERRTYWEQGVSGIRVNENISNAVELLMQLEGDKRPDGLIVHDDNLLDGAMAGLMAAGVKVPEDLKVVAHCNYPLQARSAFPIRQLGFDCCALLRECLKIIEMIRDGLTPPEYVNIPAMFDHEIDADASVVTGSQRFKF